MAAVEKRPYGFWMATALVLGGMIGSGIFVLPGQLAPYGATGVVAWLVAITGGVLLAWVYSRLFATRPWATGVADVVEVGIGPVPALLVSWSYWVGTWTSVSILSLTAIRYLGAFWPWIGSSTLITGIAAVILLWAFTLLSLRGARSAGLFQLGAMPLKVLPLVAVVMILVGIAVANPGRFTAQLHTPFDAMQLTPAIGLAFFALVGFESAGIAAARVDDPARNIPRATIAGVAFAGLLYLIVSTGIVYAMPEKALEESGAPVALFVQQFWGGAAGLLIAAFAMIAAIGCMAANILLVGELPLGMARAGQLPRRVGRTNGRDAPTGLLIAGGVLSSILILSNTTRSLGGLMIFIINLTAAASVWVYAGACASALAQRISPVAAAIGLAFSAWVLIGSGMEALGWSVVLMLTALPLYWLRPRVVLAEQPAE